MRFSCVSDRNAAVAVFDAGKHPALARVDALGRIQSSGKPGAGPEIHFGNLEYIGEVEPVSGKAGLNLIPAAVVYSGLGIGFMDAFAHYRGHPVLHALQGIFMEPGSAMEVAGSVLTVVGQGHVLLMKAAPKEPGGMDFEFKQLSAGESSTLALPGPVLKRRDNRAIPGLLPLGGTG